METACGVVAAVAAVTAVVTAPTTGDDELAIALVANQAGTTIVCAIAGLTPRSCRACTTAGGFVFGGAR
jgi:hypothetical protein